MIKRFLKNVASVLMLVSFAAVAQAATLPKAEVSKLPALTLSAGNYSVWNGSLTKGTVDRQLQVVMNFKAMETSEEARPNGYLMHKCDFYLTFTGIKDESKKLTAKDCFLAGNYGDFGWIVIPTDDVEIEEGVQYPVVAGYDANITYKQICESVKNFTAAIHVAPAILEANPDFKVKLELRMTNPDNADDYFTVGEPAIYTADELKNGSGELPDATVSKLSALTLAPNSYSTYDGSLHKNDEKTASDRPLQIVMNFKANDTEETAKASGFDKYLCDFYLKFTGLKEGKITADNCYLAGNYGDFGWIVIPADGLELEEGVEYPVVSGYDATLNYKDICKSVKDFTAAIHVAPAILEANPDFKVSLALRMTHPENKAYFNVGAPIVYSVADLKPVAKVVVPKAEDVKVNGEALTASDKAAVENIIKEFSLNNDLTVGDNGIVCADNSDEVAAARSALVDAGVEEAQAAAAVPSVAVTFTEIKKNDEGKIVQMVFDVTPAVAVGDKSVKISSFSSDITFRLPVYSENSGTVAKIYHDGVFDGIYAIKGEGANKYVEVASKTFSTYTVEPIAVEGVARIGETGYATLEAAYTAAQAGDTVTLLNNVAVNNNDAYGLMIEKAITIDGNGKTITVADGYANTYALMYLYAISGKVTIKNLTFDGVKSGAAIWAHDADVEIDNCVFQNGEHTQVQGLVRTTCANLTVKNSQFKNNNCNFAITFNYDAAESDTMLVENCDFVGNTVNDTAIVYYVDGASSTIKDCKFVDNTVKSASHGAVVYYSNGANGSLTGNVFSGNKITAGGVRASVLALEAGTTASENAFVGNTCVSTASGTTYVGTVLNKADADSAGVAISGNYWGGNEPDCVSTKGAPVVLENYYTTYESGVLGGLEAIVANVAKIGTTGYATLLQAFAEAKSGDKVELLGDLTLQAGDIDYYQNIKIPAGVTFDGGNYELVVMESQDSDYAVIWSDGAYTVQNLSIKVMGRREANRSVFNFSKGGKLSNVKIWAQVLDIGVIYDKPVDGMSLIIENCEISNVTYAFYCDPNDSDIDVTIKNNVINSQRFGSMQHDEKIEGNTLTATCTKGISLGASFTGTVTGNTFAGARALSVYGTQTISGNAFGSSSIIELNNGAVADLSGNYWGGEAPAEGRIVADKATSVVSFTVDNYYTTYDSGVLGGLVTIASNVAEVNGVQYADLQEAINAANGGTVTLLADVTYTTVYADNKSHWNGDLNYELSIGGNVTLDLNGNAIKTTGGSSHSYYALICVRSGSLTVVDSSEAKTGAIVCSAETIAQRAYTIYNNGALVLNGGTISNTVGNYAVESVTVGATALTVNEGATVISTGIAVRVCSQGSGGTQTVRINGGTINGTYAMWVPIKNGGRDIIDMEINGGTFTGSSNAILFNTYSSADYSTDSIAIKGGVFNGAVLIGSQYATDANNTALSTALTGKVVSGGKFSNDVSDYVAGGYMLVQNEGGTYGVAVDPAYGKVAKIGETYYETIKAALDAIQEDETIQLLAGTIEEGSILFPAVLKNITIKGAADKQTVVKNTTFGSFHGGSVHYEGITIDGIVFDGSQIVFTGARTGEVVYKNWTISNCEFRNIVSASNSAIHFNLAADETLEGLTFANNVIDGVTGGNISGLRANYLSGDIVIVGNRISNVAWNAIQLIHAKVGTYTIEHNVLASGAAEGILNLYNTTATTLSIANNQFLVTEGQAGIGYLGSGDVSANYWGGEAPANLPEGVTFVNYYTTVEEDGTLGGLTEVAVPVAKVGDVEYTDLQAAIDAARSGDPIEILADVALDSSLYIPAEMTLTIDGNGHKLTPAAGFASNDHRAVLVLANGDKGYSSASKYTIKNLAFEGFSNLSRVIRANFCDAAIENCTFTGNSVVGGVITSAEAELAVTGCRFDGNTVSGEFGYGVIDIGSDVGEGTTVVANITGNVFTDNTVEYAVVFLFSSANVTGNYFNGNIHAGSNSNAAAILAGPYTGNMAYEINITDNAFDSALAKDGAALPSVFAEDWSSLGATTAFDLSSNYWGGEEPVKGEDYKVSGTPDLTVEDYYASYENGTLSGLVEIAKPVSGKVSYRAYVTNNDSRNAVQIDLENLYAKESVVVKLLDADDNVLTVTTLKAGGVEAETYTVNAVLWGNPSSSWDTEIKQTLTVDNAPATIELWLDGELCDTFENAMGDKMNDYLAMGCVYKEASIGTKYYGSFVSALAAAQDGDTISLLADVELAGTVTIDKSIAIEGNGKRVTTADGFAANGSNAMIDLVKNVTFGNIVFDGVRNVAVMRSVGGDIVMDQCVVKNCNQTVSQGLLRLACCDATITDCQFVDNTCTMVVSFGYDAANDDDVLLIDGCSFERNTCKETAVVYMADGDYGKVTDTLFADNNVSSAGNAATLYMGWGDGSEVSGCTFKDNTVVTAHATTKRFASAIFCDGCIVNENAFIGNAATRNGETIATIVAVGAYYGAADISANYWGKAEPDAGVDFTVEYTRQDVAFDSYYTSIDEDGNLGNLVEFVARIGVAGYSSIDAALAAAMDGDTVVLLADATIQNEYVVENKSLTIAGAATLTFDDTLKVKGESTLNISAQITDSVQLLDGTILKDSTINGTVFVAGNVLFRGANTVKMVYDYGVLTDYYGTSAPMCWTVEPGASLVITDKARYGLGYGDQVTIKGNLSDAKSARSELTDADASLVMHGLVAQESKGWNKDSSLTVNSAYVRIGDNNSFGNKPGNYGGAYQFKFVNSVLDASRITFYEALSTTEFLFKDSDVKMGTFMTRDADSVFTLDDTVLLSTATSNGSDEGNYHAGKLVLSNNSRLTYSAEWKVEATGVVEMDATCSITAPMISGTGKIVIDARTVADIEKQVIFADMTGFTGAIEVVGGDTYQIVDTGVIIRRPTAYAYFDGYYYDTFKDAFNAAVESGMSKVLIGVLGDSTVGTMEIPAGKSIVLDLGGNTLAKADGAKIVVDNAIVKFANGALDGFSASDVEIKGDSVATFPADTVDLSAFADTFYKTTNEDGSVSVATKFRSFIQVESGVPCIGFLKNATSEYKVYGKAELTDADWTLVDMAAADVVSDYPALPLKWFVPAVDTFRFFKVEMVEEK